MTPLKCWGQGYNWWAAHNAIDVLHPGCYSSSVSGTVNDWDFYISKLAQNGNENSLPVIAAVGSYLFDDGGNPGYNLTAVNTLETNSRVPDGYNFFAYAAGSGKFFLWGTNVPGPFQHRRPYG